MPADPPRQVVTIQQAVEICGVSRRTIYNWLRDHKIEFVRTAGGQVRIYRDSLLKGESGAVLE